MSEKQTVYNDYDYNQVKAILKKRKLQKRKRRRRALLVIFILLLIVAFFFSDFSKIKSVSVTGTELVSSEDVEKAADIGINSDSMFFTDLSDAKDRVQELPLIKDVSINKDLIGNVTIRVDEAKPIGQSNIDNVLYVIDDSGKVTKDEDNSLLTYVDRCPKLNNFTEELLQEFSEQFAQLPTQVLNQISDINYAPENTDTTLCQFVMDDGKILYVHYDDMAWQLKGNNYANAIAQYPDYKYYRFMGKYVYASN